MPADDRESNSTNQRILEQLLQTREATNKLAQNRNRRLERIHRTMLAFGWALAVLLLVIAWRVW